MEYYSVTGWRAEVLPWYQRIGRKLGLQVGGKTVDELMEEIECQVEKRYPKESKQIRSSLSTTLSELDKTSDSSNTSLPKDTVISQITGRDQTYPFVLLAKKSRRRPT